MRDEISFARRSIEYSEGAQWKRLTPSNNPRIPLFLKYTTERPSAKSPKKEVIVVPSHLAERFDEIGSASETGVDVIDLGAPRRARLSPARPHTAPARPRPLYTPNPRL
ncbi:unnamed protein product [Colias eurytheme]|nr:unnamed protein product [Colias eurytheme]